LLREVEAPQPGVSKPTSGLYSVASLTSLTLAGTHDAATSDDLGGFPGGGRPTCRPDRWVHGC
jgi:hypothetical protein